MTDLTLRPIDGSEFPEYFRCLIETFGEDPHDDFREMERSTFEPKRSLAAFDRQRVVATSGIYTRTMTVPGTELPIAAVTLVTVSPTHRRRGLLTSMMRRQLSELHDQSGEPVASLWASEGSIYGRFGYGVAARCAALTAWTRNLRLRPDVSTGDGQMVLVGEEEARPHLAGVYEQARAQSPGWLDRRDRWWDALLFDSDRSRSGASSLRFALYEQADGRVGGYAIYRTKPNSVDDEPRSVVQVHELAATSPASYAAVWQFVLNLDLIHLVEKARCPVDEPLQLMVTDPRAVRLRVGDGLWVRVVDVDRGLAARRYAEDVDVVLAVDDPFCPWNTGRWRLSGGPQGAECAPTTDPADLRLGAEALGAAYLGGTSLGTLAAAGRVSELRPGALRAASRAFAGEREPWCPEVF